MINLIAKVVIIGQSGVGKVSLRIIFYLTYSLFLYCRRALEIKYIFVY